MTEGTKNSSSNSELLMPRSMLFLMLVISRRSEKSHKSFVNCLLDNKEITLLQYKIHTTNFNEEIVEI